jgi:DNA-binding NarL/FixJ family response regulator
VTASHARRTRIVKGTDVRKKLLLADDHRVLLDVLIPVLRKDFEIAGIVGDGRTMLEMARQHRPDIVLADISLPLLNGIDAARAIGKELPFTRVIFFTMYGDVSLVEEAFRAGAKGFVLKVAGMLELLHALNTVARGETYITPMIAGDVVSTLLTNRSPGECPETKLTSRQRQTLQLIAEGKTMKEAASLMQISKRTVETHKYEVMRKFGLQSTAALVRYALRINPGACDAGLATPNAVGADPSSGRDVD